VYLEPGQIHAAQGTNVLSLAIHIVLSILAGLLLWKLLRVAKQAGRTAGLIITAGFLCRAFLAQLLFWISVPSIADRPIASARRRLLVFRHGCSEVF
jgi:membrane-anchored protein YejM (alkaline phosphatase superfamily)